MGTVAWFLHRARPKYLPTGPNATGTNRIRIISLMVQVVGSVVLKKRKRFAMVLYWREFNKSSPQ